jgi:hypothetical protein
LRAIAKFVPVSRFTILLLDPSDRQLGAKHRAYFREPYKEVR